MEERQRGGSDEFYRAAPRLQQGLSGAPMFRQRSTLARTASTSAHALIACPCLDQFHNQVSSHIHKTKFYSGRTAGTESSPLQMLDRWTILPLPDPFD